MKEKLKYQSNYAIDFNLNGDHESLDIIQEENVKGRQAIKITFGNERWRTPTETIKLLEKIIELIGENFV